MLDIGEGGHVGESNISSPVTVQDIYPSIEEVFHLLLVQTFVILFSHKKELPESSEVSLSLNT